jgi:hypothetical protein
MTPADFRRIALSFEGVEEVMHAGLPAFRVAGGRFASLASQAEGYGNLTLTIEDQRAFVEEAPEIFLPIPGGWGKLGHTHIRLAAANEISCRTPKGDTDPVGVCLGSSADADKALRALDVVRRLGLAFAGRRPDGIGRMHNQEPPAQPDQATPRQRIQRG